MHKLGLLPSKRQNELIGRSYQRLISAGMLVSNGTHVRLTPKGEAELRKIGRATALKRPRTWDKRWRVLIFDIPEYRRATRDGIRSSLQSVGFVRLQNSVWVYPYDCEDFVMLLKADFRIGKDMRYMIVDAIEKDAHLREKFGLNT